MVTQKFLDELTYQVIGSAIEVHKIMGKGLLESVYHQCLKEELFSRNIVELKTVSEINPMHEAQLLTYIKLLKAPKGIIINFNCFNIFSEGQKTFVNEYFRELSKQ